jgi:hypothetical protein
VLTPVRCASLSQAHRVKHTTRLRDLPVQSRWRLPLARAGADTPVSCWGPPSRAPWREKRYYEQGRVGEQQFFRGLATALTSR